MGALCVWIVRVYVTLWAIAVILLVVGVYGLFGQEQDPLSGVFLIPLGLPWNQFIDVAPEASWPWLAAAAPFLNIALVWAVCRLLSKTRTPWSRGRGCSRPGSSGGEIVC